MTNQPSAANTDSAFLYDINAHMKLLTPSFEALVQERFSAEARTAQNLAMSLAALGIAVQAGLVVFNKVTAQDFEFQVASATAGVGLLAVISAFFLTRFLFLAWRDSCAYRLKTFAAAVSMNDASQSMQAHAGDLHRSVKELEDFIEIIQTTILNRQEKILRYCLTKFNKCKNSKIP